MRKNTCYLLKTRQIESENSDAMKESRLAVLIDAENVSYSYVKDMLEEISKNGTPTIKRIYADWTKSVVSGWKNVLLENAITPIQQYSYTSGKNATDSALIIDAMDILYSDKVDGFCIVSSDSDFTRLATRLRESGMLVIGFGEKKTPQPFISSCDKFIYLEILKNAAVTEPESGDTPSTKKAKKEPLNRLDSRIVKLLTDSVNDLADENGYAFLGSLGNFILKKKPDFDPRNYGFPKLLMLIKSVGKFEIDERESGSGNNKLIYVKLK